MGVVYRARQVKLDREVAIKMLLLGQRASSELVERFKREAQAAARLHHPNIVPIHEVGEVDGQSFFSMDYIAGKNLAQILAGKPLPARDAARYVQAIAEAVHYAHGQGIIHRDLKPSNVLVESAEDTVHLTDFGLAKRVELESDLTLTGQVLGSPNHMAPELAAGQHARVGPPSDLYSLGAILYELLTGRPPFLAESVQETLLKIRDVEPMSPRLLNRRVPRDLETLCLKCLEKDPASRIATARELAEELGRYLEGEPIRTRPAGVLEKTWRWCPGRLPEHRFQPGRASLSRCLHWR
jgi:serine/threonine-protein kinase